MSPKAARLAPDCPSGRALATLVEARALLAARDHGRAALAVAHAKSDQLRPGQHAIFSGQIAKPRLHGGRVGGEQPRRDAEVDLPVDGVIGLMKFDLCVRIDADVRQAQRQRAGRAAFMQPDLAVLAAISFGERFIIADQSADVLVDDDRRRHGGRRQIAQDAPLLYALRLRFSKHSPCRGEHRLKGATSASDADAKPWRGPFLQNIAAKME